MSDTTAAPDATTVESNGANNDVAPETTTTTEPEVKVEQKVEPKQETYDWVPKKFLTKDGTPDFQAMSKSYLALEKRQGSKSFAPETIDDYTFEGKMTYDEETTKAFKEKAQKAGLSTEQYKWVMGEYEEMLNQVSYTPERAESALKEAWGDSYTKNMQNAIRAYELYVPSNISIEEIGNNPAVIAILARVGADLSEDTTPAKSSQASTVVSKGEILKIMKEPDYYRNAEKQKMVTEWYQKNAK